MRLFLLWMLVLALPVQAQFSGLPTSGSLNVEQLLEQRVEFSTSPRFPRPYEQVRVTIETFSFDIRSADTVWYVDGVERARGVGIRDITFLMEGADKVKTVRVVAELGVETIDRSFIVSASVVDVIQEPETYTPSWYGGKSLAIDGATTRIVALPYLYSQEKKRLYRTDELVFEWEVDGTPVSSGNRQGQNTIRVVAKQFRPKLIEVRVFPRGEPTVSASGSSILIAESPFLRMYAEDPLGGVEEQRALEGISTFQEDELTFVAEPFYLLGKERDERPRTYEWRINNELTPTGDVVPWKITLRSAGGGPGNAEAAVSLLVWDGTSLFERVSDDFFVRFGL